MGEHQVSGLQLAKIPEVKPANDDLDPGAGESDTLDKPESGDATRQSDGAGHGESLVSKNCNAFVLLLVLAACAPAQTYQGATAKLRGRRPRRRCRRWYSRQSDRWGLGAGHRDGGRGRSRRTRGNAESELSGSCAGAGPAGDHRLRPVWPSGLCSAASTGPAEHSRLRPIWPSGLCAAAARTGLSSARRCTWRRSPAPRSSLPSSTGCRATPHSC